MCLSSVHMLRLLCLDRYELAMNLSSFCLLSWKYIIFKIELIAVRIWFGYQKRKGNIFCKRSLAIVRIWFGYMDLVNFREEVSLPPKMRNGLQIQKSEIAPCCRVVSYKIWWSFSLFKSKLIENLRYIWLRWFYLHYISLVEVSAQYVMVAYARTLHHAGTLHQSYSEGRSFEVIGWIVFYWLHYFTLL